MEGGGGGRGRGIFMPAGTDPLVEHLVNELIELHQNGGAGRGIPMPPYTRAVASILVALYYTIFDSNLFRPILRIFYRDASIMNFMGQEFVGADSIAAFLVGTPFLQRECSHQIFNINILSFSNSYPLTLHDTHGCHVYVSGLLHIWGDNSDVRVFNQVFHFVSAAQGGFFIANDIFHSRSDIY